MVSQIEFIRDFTWEGKQTEGVVWWESSDKAFRNLIKLTDSVKEKSQITKDKNVIIRQYTLPFLNRPAVIH